jgi:hypothetical protein
VSIAVRREGGRWPAQLGGTNAQAETCRDGSKLGGTARSANSANNPNHPNPKALVHWGDQTWDEMMFAHFDYCHADGPAPKAGTGPTQR